MATLGISDSTRVVVYDERGGIYARAALVDPELFRPHQRGAGERRLDQVVGGASARRPTAAPAVPAGHFTARPQPEWVATAATSSPPSASRASTIVDARTQAEIDGKDLRNIRRGGFVPSSVPVYWEDLLDPQLKTFKPADEIRKIYEARGIVPSKEIIAYCQVGMRAVRGSVRAAPDRLRQPAQLLRRVGGVGQSGRLAVGKRSKDARRPFHLAKRLKKLVAFHAGRVGRSAMRSARVLMTCTYASAAARSTGWLRSSDGAW